ncbi:MAG TPA: hypothetical protein VKA96_06605 [Solirubrobacteraceae bacterium]|nr:hypothetical protein [Solirubrobacteraceae bacterium]
MLARYATPTSGLAGIVLVLLLLLSAGCRAVAQTEASAEPGEGERAHYLEARWAPGQLRAHFDKHGPEGSYRAPEEYDRAARETIRDGVMFTYVDRETQAPRVGFYDRANNRFTGLTGDGARITTHFRPDRGEIYVRRLERSTYR